MTRHEYRLNVISTLLDRFYQNGDNDNYKAMVESKLNQDYENDDAIVGDYAFSENYSIEQWETFFDNLAAFHFYVEGKFSNTGKTSAKVLTAEQAAKKGYYSGYRDESGKTYDLYVDGFKTLEEANQWVTETKNA